MAISRKQTKRTSQEKRNESGGSTSVGGKKGGGARETEQAELKSVMVENMIQELGRRFKDPKFRATVGDFIRLLQLQKEIEEESPKEVRVTWVEPAEEESATET